MRDYIENIKILQQEKLSKHRGGMNLFLDLVSGHRDFMQVFFTGINVMFLRQERPEMNDFLNEKYLENSSILFYSKT